MNKERLMKVLLGPLISEKSTRMSERDKQFAFKVLRDSTKAEIKNAVEMLFEVKVKKVQVINMDGKTRTYKQIPGRKNHWKKAYVSLQEGYDINFATGT